jgi:hypothetical protein
VRVGDVEDVDILIASSDSEPAAQQASAEILTIRSSPELSGENDNSVYRYDRAALMRALSKRAAASEGNRNG